MLGRQENKKTPTDSKDLNGLGHLIYFLQAYQNETTSLTFICFPIHPAPNKTGVLSKERICASLAKKLFPCGVDPIDRRRKFLTDLHPLLVCQFPLYIRLRNVIFAWSKMDQANKASYRIFLLVSKQKTCTTAGRVKISLTFAWCHYAKFVSLYVY